MVVSNLYFFPRNNRFHVRCLCFEISFTGNFWGDDGSGIGIKRNKVMQRIGNTLKDKARKNKCRIAVKNMKYIHL